jgi:hypothetical protein
MSKSKYYYYYIIDAFVWCSVAVERIYNKNPFYTFLL